MFLFLGLRLNLENLEKEVNTLKSQLQKTEKKLDNAPDDVKSQLGRFVEVKDIQVFVFIFRIYK